MAQTFVPSYLLDPANSPYQNILINGGMEFWQRGISFNNPSDLQYVADRWKVRASVITGVLVTQESATANKDRGNYSMKVVNTTSGGRWNIQQDIEDFLSYSGKTVTATCRIKCNTASAVRIAIGNNTSITAYSSFHTGSNTFETLSVSITLANPETDLSVHIGFIDTGNKVPATFYIDSVMLVLGSAPVAFVPKDPQTELAQCQRYYEKSYEIGTFAGTITDVGTSSVLTSANSKARGGIPFKVVKRIAITPTQYNPATGASGTWRNPQTGGDGGVGMLSCSTGLNFFDDSAGVSSLWYGHWVASAEL